MFELCLFFTLLLLICVQFRFLIFNVVRSVLDFFVKGDRYALQILLLQIAVSNVRHHANPPTQRLGVLGELDLIFSV